VFAEKISGAVSDRKALAKAVAVLAKDDVLLVTKLAGFRSLGDPWADTTTPHGKPMITVLGGLAEFERHPILARTNEGRERAKARGVGRKLKLTPHQRREALARRAAGEALDDIGRTFGVKPLDDLEARACGRLIG
jgi:DNA invertase Pin-like site-specific DNA recombinase